MKRFALFLAFVLFLTMSLVCASRSSGQAAYGTIIGTVTDTSDAAVAGAQITVTDLEKGTTQTVTTNASGYYSVAYLVPGKYKVTITLSGFKTFVQDDLPVLVGTSSTLNATLQVGEIKESVTASALPPMMETDRASVATDLSTVQIESLPLQGRNFTELELLLPGSSLNPWQHGQTENPQQGLQINSNGQLFSGTNFMIDGMDNTDPVLGIIIINPPIDSVQETKATTSNFDPEYSQAGGAVIQVQTRSGTNVFHGSLYEFLRNDVFEARDPFTQPSSSGVPPLRWNQFGGSIGGPIKKDKLFGFFDYQGTRQRNGGSLLTRVPTAAERTGDLSDLGVNIYDPTTGNADGSGRVQFRDPTRATASNPLGLNIIPQSRITAQAVNLLALLPLANLTPANAADPNYIANGVQVFDTNQFDVRVDYNITSKLQLFGRYSYGGYNLNTPGAFGKYGGPQLNGLSFEGISDARNQNGVGSLTYELSPTLFTDVRFGVVRYRVFVSSPDASTQLATEVGIPGLNDPNRKDTWGLPDLNINSTAGFQMGFQCNCPLDEEETEFQGANNWTKLHGNHTIKWGADIRHRQNKRLPSDQHRAGVYSFNNGVTSDNVDGTATGGLGLAGFLLGSPDQFNRFAQISTDQQDVQWSMYYYLQDTWRITPKLTINYGLRWDTWFADTSLNSGQGGRYDVSTNTVYIPGVGSVPTSGGVNTQYHNISPRLGIVYALTPKTIIRAGYGRSYFQGNFGWTFNTLAADVYPSIVSQNIPTLSSYFPVQFDSSAIPGTPSLGTAPPAAVFPTIPSSGQFPLPDGISTANIPTDQKIPYVDSYSLMIERAVFKDATLSAGYVGNVGRHLNAGWGLNESIPGPGTDANLRKPLYLKYGLTQGIFNKCDCFSSSYNALQVKFNKRFSSNYSVLASYTWSKTLDFGEWGTEANQYDYRANYGPAFFMRASIFTLGHVVQLPFGRGQHFGNDWGTAMNAILGGWEWTGITTIESGLPFEPSVSNASLNSSMSTRPDLVGDPYAGVPKNASGWFNPSAFAVPAPYTFGNSGRNILRGPGVVLFNWGLDKNFTLTERLKLQFRWELFNTFNHANLALPNNDVTPGNSSAGQIFDVAFPMRNQQFGLRLTF
jgi:Carboxypeptidase regulatory-like domain/TonB dependent receptor